MRRPRAERARSRKARAPQFGLWSATCQDCKAKFRVNGIKPKTCISCKSRKLEVKDGRMTAEEKAEQDARFAHAAVSFVGLLLDLFGIEVGFIPPAPPPPGLGMSRHEAALFIATYSATPKDYILDSTEARDRAYKKAAAALHPDKPGGSHDLFVKLQEAKAALEEDPFKSRVQW